MENIQEIKNIKFQIQKLLLEQSKIELKPDFSTDQEFDKIGNEINFLKRKLRDIDNQFHKNMKEEIYGKRGIELK